MQAKGSRVLILRMAVGAGVTGGFLGVILGALGGIVYGAWIGDVSKGLDGAILLGFGFIILGALGGVALGVRDQYGSHDSDSEETPHLESFARQTGTDEARKHAQGASAKAGTPH